VLRRIFGPKREEAIHLWRKLRNEESYNVFFSTVFGTRSTHAGDKEPIKTSVAKPDGIKPRGIGERSCKNNIEFDFKEMIF